MCISVVGVQAVGICVIGVQAVRICLVGVLAVCICWCADSVSVLLVC